MKFFPSNIRITQRSSDQTNPKAEEPSDAKEILLLSSGILVLTLGLGGLFIYSEEEPVPATASQPVGHVEMAKAFSSPAIHPDLSGALAESPTLLPQVEAHTLIPDPIPTALSVSPSSSTFVNFGFSQAGLTEEGKAILSAQVAHLSKDWEGSLRIQGHTDLRGSDSYNRVLGAKRAEAVKTYLVSLGIPQDRIQADSFGKDAPLCQEDLPSCHDQNRRAEVEWLESPVAKGEEPLISMGSSIPAEGAQVEAMAVPALAEADDAAPVNPAVNDSPIPEESTSALVTSEVGASPDTQP